MKEFKLLGYTFNKKEKETWAQMAEKAAMNYKVQPESTYNGFEYPIYEEYYDGEKTTGELGAPIHYIPSYSTLSARSWQAFTESDIAQIIVKAHVNWVIGSGLKLQSEPVEGVIDKEGFNFDKDEFVKDTEERFRLYAKTKDSVYSKKFDYNQSQRVTYLNAIVSGDVLSIDMVENGLPVKRLIDGINIDNPDIEEIEAAKKRGNEVIHGVEIASSGEHVAFFVREKTKDDLIKYVRITAKGKNTNRLQAYLIYGTENRLDSVRGMPLLHAVIEKIKKLDRYNEAIVGGTEEKAKIPWIWEHDQFSDGSNPDLANTINKITGEESTTVSAVIDVTDQTRLIKKTYGKDPVNAPVGTKLKKIDGGMETDQEVFVTGNFIYICASVEIPYEVALMKYVNSFSSSRMASQSWSKILEIKRTNFNSQYNKNFYNTFLDTQILGGKIKADGYLSALNKNDIILIEAYRNCRFTGIAVPQADPSKEVKAQIDMINEKLTSRERAMEILDSGDDFTTVVDKLSKEKEMIEEKLPESKEEDSIRNG